jgi:organic hydroperoxide reductase OsmC/OhrA
MSTALETVLYTAKTHTVGGRTGTGKSSDGELDVKFS